MTVSLAPPTSQHANAGFDVDEINDQLSGASPQQILKWAIENVPHLYQSTALGLTGVAAIDMIARLSRQSPSKIHAVPIFFVDTLYHFQETLDLLARIEKKYKVEIGIWKPQGANTVEEFEKTYGQKLWESDEASYDYLVKVEPARRAYATLGVKAVITGRRASQGSDRATLQAVEIDSTGLIKINPLVNWNFQQVKDYIDMAGVPYNALLDNGYKSIGDWHSTAIPKEGDDERSGRWAGNKEKTECGLHKDYTAMKKAFEKKQREKDLAAKDIARGDQLVTESHIALA